MQNDIAAQDAATREDVCEQCNSKGCDHCGFCRPPALWAGEQPREKLSSSSVPTPEPIAMMAARIVEAQTWF